MAYECAGAGQHTIQMFDGQSWQDRLELLAPQMETFRHLTKIHRLLELLNAASALSMPKTIEDERLRFIADLSPAEMDQDVAYSIATGPLPSQVNVYLRSLAAFAPKPANI